MATPERVDAWDGLRALAVAGVLAYHLRATWLPGGFLGVSLFFTLSGYLITGLLLDEQQASGRVALGRFWVRRLKRLLPASLACVVLVLALARQYSPAQQRHLPGDVAGVLGWVANWRFLADRVVYGGTDPTPSPLRHAWSLAIEQQFYVVLPLLLLAGWALARRRGAAAAVIAALGASVVAGMVVGADPAVAYFRTDVRIAELLVGSAGALAVRTQAGTLVRRVSRWVAPAALLVLLVSWTQASETSRWLPRGGFLLHAVGALAVVIASGERGRLRWVFSRWPLVGVGRISYGIYLYHWPLFLVLTAGRLGTSTAVANTVALAASLGAAVVSWFLIERPVQRWQPSRPLAPLVAAPVLSTLVLAATLVSVPRIGAGQTVSVPSVGDDEILLVGDDSPPSATATVGTTRTTSTTTSTTAPATTVVGAPTTTTIPLWTPALPTSARDLGRPPRILIMGDSVAWSIGANAVPGTPLHGLAKWGRDTGQAEFRSFAALACGISTFARGRWTAGNEFEPLERCDWRRHVPEADRVADPDVVMLLTGIWEITDRKLPGDDTWRAIGDPLVDADLEASLREWILLEQSLGVAVVLVLPPDIDLCRYYDPTGPCPYVEDDPARMEAWRQIERRLARELGATVFDLPEALRQRGLAEPRQRHDGLHWSPEQADRDAQWLGPLLTDAAIRLLTGSPAATGPALTAD